MSLIAAVYGANAQQQELESKPSPELEQSGGGYGVELIWGLKISMRDQIQLNGTVYKPAAQKEPLPVILTLTPYISDTYQSRALYFAQHGYVFVLVDARGRGNSEGNFNPFAQEPHDGYDVVEFLAKQSWCNGKVAMWGGSYAGFDQWATLKEAPPHLVTIVPAAPVRPGLDFPFYNGIWFPYDLQWLTFTSGRTGNSNLFKEDRYWEGKFRQMYMDHKAYKNLDQIVGNPSSVFQEWIRHPTSDSYWQSMCPTPTQFASISVPILTITGDYDADQAGALSYYQDHMKYGKLGATANHYLIVGPWDHDGTRTPQRKIGGLLFGEASALDLNRLHLQWYDWTLKGASKPEFLKKRVAYYLAGEGAEQWKYADSLGSVATETRKLYLGSRHGIANDAFASGEITDQPSSSAPDKFTYDPNDVRPGDLERQNFEPEYTGQRSALNLFGNGVVYHSSPLPAATEVSGHAKLSVWIAMDVPDTDLSVSIYEILPNGGSVQLATDALRARYRESRQEAKLVTRGEIIRYEFDGLTWFSRRLSKGSRLRLVLNCINSIFAQKNYNSGGEVSTESAKDALVAHVTVYHDSEHQSVLEVPIVR